MIEPQTWVADALARMKKAFGPRLAYLGLQGSYRRGEATETSDIDLVVLLDTVEPADLDIYRSIVHALPEGHKACVFCSGTEEFFHWPRHELLPFSMDTDDYYGRLKDFLPPLSQEDARAGAKIGASALLHLLTHSYLYAEPEARPAILKDAYKAAFFVMQVVYYLASGQYCRSKKELLACLDGAEKEILQAGLDVPAWLAAHTETQDFALLRGWCGGVLTGNESV